MARSALSAFAVLTAVCLSASAQPPNDAAKKKESPTPSSEKLPTPGDAPPKPKAPPGPPEFEVLFSDNSNVKVVVLDASVSVTTRYGKLTVPVAELKRLELGFRYPEGVESKVTAAIANLGSPVFREREEAEKELLNHKEYSVPLLRQAIKSTDAEVTRRAEDVLKRLLAKLPDDRLKMKEDDTVETMYFTIRGRLETTTIKVKTRQFGETALKIDEVKTLRSLFTGSGNSELTLDAAKYAKQGWTDWFDTEIDVSTDAGFQVTATGQIDQWPQEPGRYTSGPGGNGATAPGNPAGMALRAARGNVPPGFAPNVIRHFPSGSIVGKIGTDGEPFPIGANFKSSKAPGNGRLYLAIAPSNWGNVSSGSYKVQVKVGE